MPWPDRDPPPSPNDPGRMNHVERTCNPIPAKLCMDWMLMSLAI